MKRKYQQANRVTLILGTSIFLFTSIVNYASAAPDPPLTGRELTHSYDHGNCLACHSAPADKKAVTLANIGPPFIDMKRRFPSKDALFKQIWDARDTYPETIMPPFGANNILSETEIRKIINYLYTL